MVKEFFDHTTPNDIGFLFLIVVSSMLSSVGGVCGGMFNFPLAIYMLGFNSKEAMSLSCSLIFGLNLTKVMLSLLEDEFRTRRQILFDLDIAAIFAPMTVIGSTFGVMLNQILPQFISLILFGLSILPLCGVIFKKAVSLHRQEQVSDCCNVQTNRTTYHKSYPVLWDRLLIIVGYCLLVFIFSMLKKHNMILDVSPCSLSWWLLTLAIIPFAILGQVFILSRIQGQQMMSLNNTQNEDLIQRNNQLYKDRFIIDRGHHLRIISIGIIIGLSSGLFGIGGCLFTGAYLMSQNFNPRISSFTTGFMTMYSSFVSLIQLVIMGNMNYSYSLISLVSILIGTFIGVRIVLYLINQKQRHSYIVFTLSGIIFMTIVIIFSQQIADVVKAVQNNTKIFEFNPSNVCK